MSNATNKIIVVAFTTLDGVVEDPDGSWGTPFGGWGLRHGPQAFTGDKFRLGAILDTGALLFGRRTWQQFSQRWPTRTDDFADAMNRARKYVASRTLEALDSWSNSTVLQDELTAAIDHLRAQRDIVVAGSTSIVHQLAANDLVDEYRVFVFPTVAGAGSRLFARGVSADLKLVSTDVTGPGVLLQYQVVR